MWQASNGSVNAPTMASTTAPSCIRCPHRMPGSQYWPRLIDSAPPATAASASPSMMAWAAETIACRPLPHSRFTVNAGVSTGRPPLTAATRLRYMSRVSVWITLPKAQCPTAAGSTRARRTDSATTAAARSHGGTLASPPPYFPMAVRTPDRMKTSLVIIVIPSHVQAAVDGPDLAGDVGRLVGGEEADGAGDLLRPGQPAKRDLLPDPLQRPFRHGGHHVGGHISGGDRVDGQPDTLTRSAACPPDLEDGLLGQRLGQAEQPGLGRGVVGLADLAGLADHRGNVDDPAGALLDHVFEGGLGHEEGAGQVDRDHPLPVLVGHLRHGLVDRDACVVDQDVQTAVPFDDLGHHAAAVTGRADVALVDGEQPVRVARGHVSLELRSPFLVPPIAGRHRRPGADQLLADRTADAGGAAGDEGDPPGEGSFCGRVSFLRHGHR